VLPGGGEPCQLCVGSSSDVGSCDVRSVVRLACLLPVGGGVAPDVRVISLLAYRKLANTRGAVHCLDEQCVRARGTYSLWCP
jgi:hypothetical protein